VDRDVTRIRWNIEAAEKGGFPHFTLKEIYEQPHALQEALRSRVRPSGELTLPMLDSIADKLRRANRVYLVGCGTAGYAAQVGAYLIQDWARLPAFALVGSEMRYAPPPIDDRTLVISVTQSGETADTLAPQKMAAEAGATIVAVTNVVGSAITREADAVCYLQAGPEVAVASTKAFVTQLVVLSMIAMYLGRLREAATPHQLRTLGLGLRALPGQAAETLRRSAPIKKLAQRFSSVQDMIYIGRGLGFPTAMEGALKLKELSYVHAEGYAAGELKHGPIALLDENTPLVAIVTAGSVYEKVLSNVAEARARQAPVIAVATDGDDQIGRYAQDIIYVPETLEALSPVIAVLPLQLLAYEMAVARGTDVDQPRNLAKSVTVE
jgi:glutamine---fructose-6-phosphate transaminase (isomerizing)